MQTSGSLPLLTTAGVVVASCVIALIVDRLFRNRPRAKRTLPIIGITFNVTDRFFVIWIVVGLIVFVASVFVGVYFFGPTR